MILTMITVNEVDLVTVFENKSTNLIHTFEYKCSLFVRVVIISCDQISVKFIIVDFFNYKTSHLTNFRPSLHIKTQIPSNLIS